TTTTNAACVTGLCLTCIENHLPRRKEGLSIEARIVVVVGGGSVRRRRGRRLLARLQEDHRVLRGDVELGPAGLADDVVVEPDHVVAQFGKLGAVAIVGA